jgi:uncharacterized protein
VLLAFSGGVDSTFLLKICVDVLGKDNVVGVTALSDSYTKDEQEYAKSIAKNVGIEHVLLTTDEMSDNTFVSNTPERCYYCKKHLFHALKNLAEARKIECILDASNSDDENDYRPGRRAAKEFSIQSPLIEAGITKEDIRRYSKALGLNSWKKPANPCLASRIPYGDEITKDKLKMIEEAEIFLRNMGFKTVRVRHHGKVARIEIPKQDIRRLVENQVRTKIIAHFKHLGFVWIAMDIEGYRTGSLNEILHARSIKK